jgi:diguanylate cyclase (GGDEF)-like protein/PAS domain S-box-containing protein
VISALIQAGLAEAVEQTADAILIADPAGKILFVNPMFTAQTGYSAEEAVGQSPRLLQSGLHPREYYQNLWQTIQSGQVWNGEITNRRKDGTLYNETMRIAPVRDAQGQISSYVAIKRDLTENKRTAETLHESLETLTDAQRIGSLGYYTLEIPSGRWTSSDVLDEIFGIGKDYDRTVAGWVALIQPADRAMIDAYFTEEVIGPGKTFDKQYRIIRQSDQAERWVHGTGKPVFDSQGRPVKMHGVVRDITEQKLSEMQLRDSEMRFRETFEQAAIGIVHVSFDGRLLRYNQRFAEIIGYPPDEVPGLSFRQITLPEDRPRSKEVIERVSSGELDNASWEKRYIRKDGSITWTRGTISTQRDGEGRPLHLIAFIEDINSRKLAEQSLITAQKALQSSEERYRLTFQTSIDSLLINRLSDGVYIDCNQAFLETVGYEREEILGQSSLDIGIWANPSDRFKMLETLRLNKFVLNLEAQFRKKNGTLLWGLISASVIELDGVPCILTVTRDISEIKATAERLAATTEALRASEERYRTVFEASLDAISISNLDKEEFVEINQAFLDNTGYERAEVIGRSSLELGIWADPGDRLKLFEAMRLNKGCLNLEVPFRKKNGTLLWGLMSASLKEVGGAPCVLSIIRNISGIKADAERLAATTEALRASEEHYRTVFQASLDAIAITRLDNGKIIDVNQGHAETMGYEHQEVVGRTALELDIWADPADREIYVELLRQQSHCRNLEARFRKKSGEVISGLISASLIEIDGVLCILSFLRDISDLKDAEEKIRSLAFYDPLTALPNRRLLLDRLQHSLAAGSRTDRKCALLFIDLDNFKTLNDTLGHHTGDLLLRETARRLTASIREADTVARLGGDEFVVMLENLSSIADEAATQVEAITKKILTALDQPYWLEDRECLSTSSIGIKIFGDRAESVNDLLQHADIALYQAKAAGRNTMRFYAPALQVAIHARASMEKDLRHAIKTRQFALYYQPQVNSTSLIGAETLIRWNHPLRGILSPGEFIPLAEETGMIVPMGEWVLETACKQIAAWSNQKEMAHLSVSVNISARQFRQPDFVQRVLAALDRTGANPQNLKLELTESMLLDNIEEIIARMTVLKSYGIEFALDDFGTGYSSLSYLRRLPLNQLKIDRSFVWDMLCDASSRAIVQTIISLGNAMGLQVTAEGVETDEQRDYLLELGCHSFQGYLFGRPLPVEEFQSLSCITGRCICWDKIVPCPAANQEI